jgi:hypothetical protein
MDAAVILCDFAEQDPTGKVHMLGAGWSVMGPAPAPHAVVIFVKGPVDLQAPLPVTLRLLDADGNVVVMPGGAGMQRFEFPGQILMRMPPVADAAVGFGAFTINVSPLPFQPGARYRWVLEVDGKEAASAEFMVLKPESPASPTVGEAEKPASPDPDPPASAS